MKRFAVMLPLLLLISGCGDTWDKLTSWDGWWGHDRSVSAERTPVAVPDTLQLPVTSLRIAASYSCRTRNSIPDAPLSEYRKLLKVLGLERAVLVQPSVYGTDNTALLDALAAGVPFLNGAHSGNKRGQRAH